MEQGREDNGGACGQMGEIDLAALEIQADEICRRAEAAADLVKADADRYAHRVRGEIDRLLDHARRQIVIAEEEALARREAAERDAAHIVRDAEQRARRESEAILDLARRRLAEVVESTRPGSKLPRLGRQSLPVGAGGAASVIDLRTRAEVSGATASMPVVPSTVTRHDPVDDALDALVGEAVSNAVRRSIHPSTIHAGRYT
jgi:hypothetical protein